MARQLTREAKEKVLCDGELYVDLCKIMDVKPSSLPPLVYRNSPWLTNHDVLLRISEAMNKTIEEILEEIAEPATL